MSDSSPRDRGSAPAGGESRVWLLNAAIAGAALTIFTVFVRGLPVVEPPMRVPWWVLAVLFCVTEICVAHFEFGRNAHTFSMGEIPMVLGLCFAEPAAVVAAQLVGAAVALTVHRRQRPLKLAFNLGHFSLEACLAVVIFHSVAAYGEPLGPATWAGAFLATMVTLAVSDTLINTAIRLSGGSLESGAWYKVFGVGAATTITNTSFGLITATIVWIRPQAAWLLLVPTAAALLAYRA